MNKYIIPICNISESKVFNVVIMASSITSCKEKLIEKYSDYSESDDWNQFVKDLDCQDIIVGKIKDIEEL